MPNPLCQPVIIANTETILVSTTGGAAVARTPAISKVTNAGSVTAGKKSVSLYVSGASAATILGASLAAGTVVTFTAEGADTLAAISYDATGSEITISTLA